MPGGGREGEKGQQAASKLGLSDTRLTASPLLRQEMHFPLYMSLFFPSLFKTSGSAGVFLQPLLLRLIPFA